jgi:hypothetical protein
MDLSGSRRDISLWGKHIIKIGFGGYLVSTQILLKEIGQSFNLYPILNIFLCGIIP